MPRGEDTSRHEGRKVHRDTPRIAALLATHLNKTVVGPVQDQIDSMRENLGEHSSFSNDALLNIADNLPDYVGEYTGRDAQDMLNTYRGFRDMSADPDSYDPSAAHLRRTDQEIVSEYQDDLRGILGGRKRKLKPKR